MFQKKWCWVNFCTECEVPQGPQHMSPLPHPALQKAPSTSWCFCQHKQRHIPLPSMVARASTFLIPVRQLNTWQSAERCDCERAGEEQGLAQDKHFSVPGQQMCGLSNP